MNDSQFERSKYVFAKRIKEARIGDPLAQYEVALMYANGLGVEHSVDQAFIWTKASAEKGHMAAQYMLGNAYAGGLGVSKDEQKATLWFLRAAEQGNQKASYKLAKIFSVAHETLSFNACLKAAEQGLADAQFDIGNRYSNGDGIEQDFLQARAWYQKAAEQGLASAQFELGQMYALGFGVSMDITEARLWYREATKQGLPAAQVALERLDQAGYGRIDDIKRPKKHTEIRERRAADGRWIKFAQRGSSDDRYHLGLMYEFGLGLEKNTRQAKIWYQKAATQGQVDAQLALARLIEVATPELAVAWYQAAADQGNAEAQFALGRLHAIGVGTDLDPLKSLKWYLRAVDQGNGEALVALGRMLSDNVDKVLIACFDLAAKNGLAQAQLIMGERYLNADGFAQDFYAARHWFGLAAEQGNPEAQCALADVCAEGLGFKKDLAQAFHWYEKAALQGFAKAQWRLGELYATGLQGVEQDPKQATLWCKKAANAGFGPAQATLGSMFARAKKYERAIYWWDLAAAQNDPEALFNLANAHHGGLGIEKNETRAFLLWLKAAQNGLAAAQARVGLAYATGEGVALDQVEAAKWFITAAGLGDKNAAANKARAQTVMSPLHFLEAERRSVEWFSARKNKH